MAIARRKNSEVGFRKSLRRGENRNNRRDRQGLASKKNL